MSVGSWRPEIPRVTKEFTRRVNRKKKPSNVRSYLIITAIVFVGVIFAQGEYGLLKIFRLRARIGDTESEITRLKVQAADLEWEINKLKSDSQYIQLYAAEHYSYAKPSSVVIQFVSPADSLK